VECQIPKNAHIATRGSRLTKGRFVPFGLLKAAEAFRSLEAVAPSARRPRPGVGVRALCFYRDFITPINPGRLRVRGHHRLDGDAGGGDCC
jgi:hypothetical protein